MGWLWFVMGWKINFRGQPFYFRYVRFFAVSIFLSPVSCAQWYSQVLAWLRTVHAISIDVWWCGKYPMLTICSDYGRTLYVPLSLNQIERENTIWNHFDFFLIRILLWDNRKYPFYARFLMRKINERKSYTRLVEDIFSLGFFISTEIMKLSEFLMRPESSVKEPRFLIRLFSIRTMIFLNFSYNVNIIDHFKCSPQKYKPLTCFPHIEKSLRFFPMNQNFETSSRILTSLDTSFYGIVCF